MKYSMTWHDSHAEVWRQIVLPLLPETPRRWLELGSYEGRSAAWTLEHAIREGDELVCVDAFFNDEVERRFDANVGSRVTKCKLRHDEYLLAEIGRGGRYNVIYVDGDHDAPAVLSDAVLAWKLLGRGGVMIFDDYHWQGGWRKPGAVDPCHAIDGFLRSHATRMRVLHHGYQVLIERTR